MVLPDRSEYESPTVESWIRTELANFSYRWSSVFRGELRYKFADQVTDEDMTRFHLVVWGSPKSNSLIERFLSSPGLPYRWTGEVSVAGATVGTQAAAAPSFPSNDHVLLGIYPNVLQQHASPDQAIARYLVINSGPTFRPAHDATNSLQNPQLPDWAIIDLSLPPNAEFPGRIAATGFFDQTWQFSPTQSWFETE